MAKIALSALKTKFESGDRPTQADFMDLIDTLAANSTDLGTNGNNDHVVTGIENTTVLETVVASEWRLLKYLVSLSKTSGGDSKFYATELTVLIDGDDLHVSQYGIVDSDGDMGTVDVVKNGTNVELKIIPNPLVKPVTARFGRMGLKA